MATYRATDNPNAFVRNADGARIPLDGGGGDAADLRAWLQSNTADPAIVTVIPDAVDSMDVLLLKVTFNHENRIRALEGRAAVTVAQFKTALRAL